ncbi:MAG: Gfo/Idh/MocA family oxidoreductase [Actinomycetota bacterium]|nr:Gfo/Idh/MocA family oxidoreductase [Actinomycetota bacterium]
MTSVRDVVSVGVIGTGSIGTDHVHRLVSTIAGARVHSVFDVDVARAAALAGEVGAVARHSARDVIDDPAVDAVLVASADASHAEMVLASIDARKPVFCEKPLAPTVPESLEILAAEEAAGHMLVQVGFMRRYDEGFRSLKSALDTGVIGQPVTSHCVHRNASSPPGFTSAMSFTSSVVHEIDTMRWLLSEEIVAVTVVRTRTSPLVPEGLRDPQIVLLETESGIVIDAEVFVNCRYGYDVRAELVGSLGAISLDDPSPSTLALDGARRQVVVVDWRDRFAPAYRVEIQQWVSAVRAQLSTGEPRPVAEDAATAWDGYAATAVADAAIAALETGVRQSVGLERRPAFYSAGL